MNQHDKSLLKMSLICFAIAAALLLYVFLAGCATPAMLPYECRHEALLVGAVLVEKNPYFTKIDWMRTDDPTVDHVQACVIVNGEATYYHLVSGAVWETPRDPHGETLMMMSLDQFFDSQRYWKW